jgi:Flp pilus assembly protein TadD
MNLQTQYDKALASFRKGTFNEALQACRAVLKSDPSHEQAMVLLSAIQLEMGNSEAAALSAMRVAEKYPSNAEAYFLLGSCCLMYDELVRATELFWKTLSINPYHAQSIFNLAKIYKDTGKQGEAESLLKTLLTFAPADPDAQYVLANLLFERDRFEESIDRYRSLIHLKPDVAHYYNNLGVALLRSGNIEDARVELLKAIDLDPHYGDAHHNLAFIYLLTGDFDNGWKEYEWRFQTSDHLNPLREYPQPRWFGEPLKGKTLLVYCEQGFGDAIQFSRYIPLLVDEGAKVIVECPDELVRLFSMIEGVSKTAAFGTSREYDFYSPLMSIPMLVGTTPTSIPSAIPFFNVDEQLVAKWRDKMREDRSNLNVGLVWTGNPSLRGGKFRSCTLEHLTPFAGIAGTTLFSLVKAKAEETLPKARPFAIVDYTRDLTDFAETAAFIMNLDLVISIDTAVAHLAGALGKPVWLMLTTTPDYRWMLDRSETPWYPSMRLFRQRIAGRWEDPIAEITAQLSEMSRKGGIQLADGSTISAALAKAVSLIEQGDLIAAEAVCLEILLHHRDHPEALKLLTEIARTKGDIHATLGYLKERMVLSSSDPTLFNEIGMAYFQKHDIQKAEQAFKHGLELEPNNLVLLINYSAVLLDTEDYENAAKVLDRAASLYPGDARILNNIGRLLSAREHYVEAEYSFRHALQGDPNNADIYNNLGVVFRHRRNFRDAEVLFRKALSLKSDFIEAHWNLSLTLLHQGQYQEGWKEYEWRWKKKDFSSPRRKFPQPRWQGERIDGKTILVHAEQGLGDTIQFLRFLSQLHLKGGAIVLQCHTALIRLLGDMSFIKEIVPFDHSLPPFDYHVPLMSIAGALDVSLENLPVKMPYIQPPQALTEEWIKRIKQHPSRLNVGLVWSGNQIRNELRHRSCPLQVFNVLSKVEGVNYFSLQKGDAAKEIEFATTSLKLIDYSVLLRDMAETAAYIRNLDLVISIDTGVAHLAGAMGTPIWTLLSYDADWRWLADREDTPWYPAMRLFRQPSRGDWSSVMMRVAQELGSTKKA